MHWLLLDIGGDMSKFLVKFEALLVVDSPHHQTMEDLQRAFDVGSRCWESEIVRQLADETAADDAREVCNLAYRSSHKIIKQVADDYPALPQVDDIAGNLSDE